MNIPSWKNCTRMQLEPDVASNLSGDLIEISLRYLCVLCASAVGENEDVCKPQRRRGRRDNAELKHH